jgi:hypothetical protein
MGRFILILAATYILAEMLHRHRAANRQPSRWLIERMAGSN